MQPGEEVDLSGALTIRRSLERDRVIASGPPARRPLARRVGATRAGGVHRASWSAGWAVRRSEATSPPPRSATRLGKPLSVVRGYALPAWTPPDRTVLCSSYSGDTEETLACYAAAEALGANRVVATTGGALAESARRDGVPVIGLPAGLQPRAAVGYMFTVAAEAAALCAGAGTRSAPRSTPPLRTSRRPARRARRARRPRSRERSTARCRWSTAATSRRPVAYRWKTQINENAKLPAFSHELPEVDHNEIAGWEGAGDGARLSCVIAHRPRPAPARAASDSS